MVANIFPIVINQSNVDPSNNSRYIYKFSRGSINLKNASIALSQIAMYNSFFNITSEYNNNSFFFIWPGASGNITYKITIPDGSYPVEAINSYLQQWMIDNNKYLINNATGKNVYYYEIITNANLYAIQLVSYEIPTSLPSGYTLPSGGFDFPTSSGQRPSITITDNKFGDLIGFTPGTYQSAISNEVPQMSAGLSSVIVRCSLISNKFSNPDDVIFSFVPNAENGKLMNIQNQQLEYSPIPNGYYDQVIINLVSNNFERIVYKDNNILILLILKVDE